MSTAPYMRFLVLAHSDDELAIRVCGALKAQFGVASSVLVAAEELSLAPRWSHTIGDRECHTTITLQSGIVIDSARIGIVFNRLQYAPMPHYVGSKASDGDYAQCEMQAMWLSWLASLTCPVINSATPRGLSAPSLSEFEWLCLSARAGLAARCYHASTNGRIFRSPDLVPFVGIDIIGGREQAPVPFAQRILGQNAAVFLEPVESAGRTVVVAGETTIGECLPSEEPGVRALARLAGCTLLQVVFRRTLLPLDRADGGWRVCAASGTVQRTDPSVVAAIAAVLAAGAKQ